MITEHDLREAIAECEGTRNPTVTTCIKLAALYAVLEHLYEKNGNEKLFRDAGYSNENRINYSDSEFSKIVQEKGIESCFGAIDELMGTLYVINPPLYKSVIRKLTETI